MATKTYRQNVIGKPKKKDSDMKIDMTTYKDKENQIGLTADHSSRPDVFYFLSTSHFLIQLQTHIAQIAKVPQANAATKALSKSAILPTLRVQIDKFILFCEINLYFSEK